MITYQFVFFAAERGRNNLPSNVTYVNAHRCTPSVRPCSQLVVIIWSQSSLVRQQLGSRMNLCLFLGPPILGMFQIPRFHSAHKNFTHQSPPDKRQGPALQNILSFPSPFATFPLPLIPPIPRERKQRPSLSACESLHSASSGNKVGVLFIGAAVSHASVFLADGEDVLRRKLQMLLAVRRR